MDPVSLVDKIYNSGLSTGDPNTMCLETTVVTGFEFMGVEECRERCKPADLTRGKGRLFFNLPKERYPEVLAMRSVDNVYLVGATMKGLCFQDDKEKDLELIKSLVEKVDWKPCVDMWAELVGCEAILYPDPEPAPPAEGQPPVLKFRATCNRTGKHSFTSMEAARDFGGTLQDKFHWTVDLTKFDIEVILNIASDGAYVTLALTKESLHRRNITHFGSTTLRSTLCYNLVRLAEPVTGEIILDPLCGGSSISIEGSIAFPYTYHIAGDKDEKAMSRSRGNVDYLKNKRTDFKMDVLHWNARRLPLKDASVDVFVTDLPFGKRSGKKQDNRPLYRAVLNELGRVVRPKTGRASVLTGDRRTFEQVLGMGHPYWKQVRSFSINQGGLSAAVFLLIRTAKTFYIP